SQLCDVCCFVLSVCVCVGARSLLLRCCQGESRNSSLDRFIAPCPGESVCVSEGFSVGVWVWGRVGVCVCVRRRGFFHWPMPILREQRGRWLIYKADMMLVFGRGGLHLKIQQLNNNNNK